MKEYQELSKIFDRLMGPGGCPWDRRQTVKSMRIDLLEEVYELIQAIDLDDNINMCEELGDVAACILFLGKLAEKEGRFTSKEALEGICEKLVRRHPHVFGDSQIAGDAELEKQWQRIKREERGGYVPDSILDGICSSLPALSRAQDVIHRMTQHEVVLEETTSQDVENQVGEALWNIINEAEKRDINAEAALRGVLAQKEQQVRQRETGYSGVA